MPHSLPPAPHRAPDRALDCADSDDIEGDNDRLIEELRVHQVELELQAEALNASQHHAEREALRYRHLLAAVPGSAFAVPGFVRLSYAASMETLRKAVDRLAAFAEAK